MVGGTALCEESWTTVVITGVSATVVNEKTLSASMVSGGSLWSKSLIRDATSVIVQVSPPARLRVGSNVQIRFVASTVAVAACVPLSVQTIVNHVPWFWIRSLNVT